MWIMLAALLGVSSLVAVYISKRKENRDYIKNLASTGFQRSGFLRMRGDEAIVFDDKNQQAAFVQSSDKAIIPYEQITRWIAEPRHNAPSVLYVHVANPRKPLWAFNINQSAMQGTIAKISAHVP